MNDDLDAIVSGGGAVDRTGRGLLHLSGPQRIWFLQQTITADVEDLGSGQWRESAFLTPKGKIVSHFYVGVLGEDVFVDIDPPTDDLADWLVRYRFRTKVEIADLSGPVLTVIGRPAAELAGEGVIRRIDGAIVFGHRLGDVAVTDVHGTLDALGAIDRVSEEVLERLRIEAGVARFGVDYTTDNLPQEAGLTRIAAIDKGCYVGQETVARIHFRGHVNKVVRPLRLDGIDPPAAIGAELVHDGKVVGKVTSAARSRRGDVAGLGLIRIEPPPGTVLEIDGGGSAVVGEIPEGTKVKTI